MSTDKTTTQLLAELSEVSTAVRDSQWSTGRLADLPAPADFGALISSPNPLATLSSSGVGMLTPHVSFLAKPLDQFRGDSGAVSGPAQGMATAAADLRALADTLRQTGTTETSGWTGEAADEHRASSAQFAEGVTAISEAAKTISGAISGAGEEVVKALAEIVRLIGEAVGKMVPVMADGIARAPLTMGASIPEAIAKCVAIANECGAEIAKVMANLLANAANLMKLVTMVLTIVDAVVQLLQKLAKLTQASGDEASAGGDTSATSLEPGKDTATGEGPSTATGTSTTEDTATSNDTGQASLAPGTTAPAGTTSADTSQAPTLSAGTASGVVPQATPGTSHPSGTSTTTGLPTGTARGVPLGGAVPVAGALPTTTSGARPPSRLAAGRSTSVVGQQEPTTGQPAATTADVASSGGTAVPMSTPLAGRGQGTDDTEHQRRYEISDDDAFTAEEQHAFLDSGVITSITAEDEPEDPAR